MLTGSVAMNYYAMPRMTRDIDVVVLLHKGNVELFVREFSPAYYISPEAVREAVESESMFNLIHTESVVKVDCIVRKSAEYRRTEFERRRAIRLADFTTFIVSKEDLILSKLAWARDSRSEMQLGDARNLLTTEYDRAYLEDWAGKLDVLELLEKARHE